LSIEDFGPKDGYRRGDVVGAGLDTRHNQLYFTLNGVRMARVVDGLRGRFHPCVWLLAGRAAVRVNFGQRAFRYDFAASLGDDTLSNLEREARRAAVLTPLERQRRARAETLLLMFPHYPLDLVAH
jgi:hypothetical protein